MYARVRPFNRAEQDNKEENIVRVGKNDWALEVTTEPEALLMHLGVAVISDVRVEFLFSLMIRSWALRSLTSRSAT